MTGERELETGDWAGLVPAGPDRVRSRGGPGVKKPTFRTLGSITRDGRRGSIGNDLVATAAAVVVIQS